MLCILAFISSIEQYIAYLQEHGRPEKPIRCPNSDCGKAGLWHNGFYERMNRSSSDRLVIYRVKCPHCGKSMALLPAFLAPRRHYPWSIQQVALAMVLAGNPILKVATKKQIDRHTIRRWRDWLRERHDAFSHHLRSRFPKLGRYSEVPSFWQACFTMMGLDDAMFCVYKGGEAVP